MPLEVPEENEEKDFALSEAMALAFATVFGARPLLRIILLTW